jgi:hypothetical protein
MTTEQIFDVGTFHCECAGPTLSGLRWKVKNTSTLVVHFTYGTEAEVRKACELQTAAWERKASMKGKVGSAWRRGGPITRKP